ncbi:transglutaminase-like domain-containing protein [Tautonia marina]|uniref:transglutaminase-like domain-containing protein n=1 Tax=Tautonia marina TaxID=2653855 RepID=UPI00126128D4|nr:transglutaminase-like domain-containing protein [Tautonia marina]
MTPPHQRSLFPVLILLCWALPSSACVVDDPPRSRTVVLTYQATVRGIPEAAEVLDLWLPVPQDDANQTIHRLTIDAPGAVSLSRERTFGNRMLHLRRERPETEVAVTPTIVATRQEARGRPTPPGRAERSRLLAPEPLVPVDGLIRQRAIAATRGLKDDTTKARAIYDSVLSSMTYDKSGSGWGRGDARFACEVGKGNCTDFHALLIGMARSSGIPAQFAIGLSIPEATTEGSISGYHCWAELYVESSGWVPVDASEAEKNPSKRDYFFGHHDQHRLEFSRGRNLTLAPSQQGPPLNFFIHPYAELDSTPYPKVDLNVTFQNVEEGEHPSVIPSETGRP